MDELNPTITYKVVATPQNNFSNPRRSLIPEGPTNLPSLSGSANKPVRRVKKKSKINV